MPRAKVEVGTREPVLIPEVSHHASTLNIRTKAKDPASEYESFDGSFYFGQRGGRQTDNSLSRPTPHPTVQALGPKSSVSIIPSCCPAFPCGIA